MSKPWLIIDDLFGAGKVGFNELRGWRGLDCANTTCRLDLHQVLHHVLLNSIFHGPYPFICVFCFLHAEKEQVLPRCFFCKLSMPYFWALDSLTNALLMHCSFPPG